MCSKNSDCFVRGITRSFTRFICLDFAHAAEVVSPADGGEATFRQISGRFFPPNSLLLGVLNSFLRCVRPLCHCWCPPFSAGHVAFLFICLPGLSLLVSALFRWPCSISIHLSPRSVTAGVCPFPLAMQHFYSFVCHRSVICGLRPFPLATAGVRPFPPGHAEFLLTCFPGLSLLVSALFRWPWAM